jgi:Desulfoferrodoxin, N-terminal domain
VSNDLGKRYVCGECNAEVLVTKPGDGALACHGQPMELHQAKPLPSSD